MNRLFETEKKYKSLNAMLKKDGIVIMGSTYASQFPLNELIRNYGLQYNAYNRSAENLSIDCAQEFFDCCVKELNPAKLFLNLGETDIQTQSAQQVAQKYQWLLYQIHNDMPDCRIYIVSVATGDTKSKELNKLLMQIAYSHGCKFIDIYEKPYLDAFLKIKTFFHEKNITFADAMMA